MRGFEELAKKLNETKIPNTCTIEESTELISQLNETVPTYPDKLSSTDNSMSHQFIH